MLLELAEEPGNEKLRPELELIRQLATQMISRTNETLDAAKIEAGRSDLRALQSQLDEDSSRIVIATNALARKSRNVKEETFKSDLSRITAAARHTRELAYSALAALSDAAPAAAEIASP